MPKHRKDQYLTGFSVRYKNASYLADRIFPMMRGIIKNSGTIPIYDKSSLREEAKAGPLGPRSEAAEVRWGVSEQDYRLARYALKGLVLDEEKEEAAGGPYDPEEDTAENLTDLLLVLRELRAMRKLFNAANLTLNVTLSGTDQWDDAASDPVADLDTAKSAMARKPNMIVLSDNAWNAFRRNDKVTDKFKYTSGGVITGAQVAELLDIPAGNVLVGDAKYNAATEGAADSLVDIWANDVALLYVNPNPGKRTMTATATLQKGESREVHRWDNDDPEGEWLRVQDYYEQRIIMPELGYYIKAAV